MEWWWEAKGYRLYTECIIYKEGVKNELQLEVSELTKVYAHCLCHQYD